MVVNEWFLRSNKEGALLPLLAKYRIGGGMNQILPNLFLGSLRDASDEEQLTLNRIQYVVTCHEMTADNAVHARLGLHVLRIRIADSPGANIAAHFRDAFRFIHEARIAGKAVLVHCLAGISRSASIVAGYLMVAGGLDFYNSIAYVTSKRRSINPNFGFRMQLCKFAERESARERESLREYCTPSTFDEQARKDLHEIHGRPLPISRSNESSRSNPQDHTTRIGSR